MSDKPNFETSMLSLRLANLEKIIERIFEMPDTSNSRVLLKKKVEQFEEMIVFYPDTASDLAEAARSIVVSMWYRFYTKEVTSSQATLSNDSANSSLVTNISETFGDVENSSKSGSKEAHASSDEVEQNSKANGTSSSTRSTASSGSHSFSSICTASSSIKDQPNVSFDLQKCKLRFNFENTFARLNDIKSGADVDSIKNLLRECARARKELALYPNDTRLHFVIFNMAFNKLPLTLREQFLSIYGSISNGINIQNLVTLLEAEIVAEHKKKVSLYNNMLYRKAKERMRSYESSDQVPSAQLNNVSEQMFCKYCKSHDHVRNDCLKIKELLCFKCFQSGHTKRDCIFRTE